LRRQIKGLIASKKRDGADVDRSQAALATTSVHCLTSSTAANTAPSNSGLCVADADEVLINTVRLKGSWDNPAILDLDPVQDSDVCVRMLIVWFNKPLAVANAAGNLPPITEVLVSDTMDSLPVTDAANGGRFVILSDRKWNLGNNTFQAATAVGHARVSGQQKHYFDYTVKVNKMMKLVESSTHLVAAGHYDSDVLGGRVDKGLLIMYVQVDTLGGSTPVHTCFTRLNYTA